MNIGNMSGLYGFVCVLKVCSLISFLVKEKKCWFVIFMVGMVLKN